MRGNGNRNYKPSHWRSFTCLIILEFFTLALFYIVVILLRSSLKNHIIDVKFSLDSFECDVIDYKFKHSLSDLMYIALWRTLVLLVAYSACRSTLRFAIVITIIFTTIYNSVKIILFTRTGEFILLEYAFIFISLLTHWLMLLFFEILYRPVESRCPFPKGFLSYYDTYKKKGLGEVDPGEEGEREREPLLRPSPMIAEQSIQSPERDELFLSPQQSPTGSPVPELAHLGAGPVLLTEEDRIYINEGEESVRIISTHVSSNGWREENASDGVTCYSKRWHRGKIYKCTGDLPIAASRLYNKLFDGLTDQPRWNDEVTEIQILKTVDEQTDVIYIVSCRPPGGMVQQRDFVQVRYKTRKNGTFYIVGRSVNFPGCPPKPGLIRGENGPGGYIIQPNQSAQNTCRFTWILDTSLKGWLPQYLIDQTLSNILIRSFKNLNTHVVQHLK